MRIISLAGTLFVFWLLLSGHYNALLLTLGVLSTALTVYVARRMRTVDEEGHSLTLFLRLLAYMPWLILAMAKSTWAIMQIVLHPQLPVRPRLVHLTASQSTAAGRFVHANSITLTPGTLSIDVTGNDFTIHALTDESAEGLYDGEMDKRTSWVEGAL